MNRVFIMHVGVVQWCTRTAVRQFTKRVLRRDLSMTLPTGLQMRLPRDSRFGTEAFVTNANVDLGAEALFARLADPRRDFLDVGANIGYYSLYLSPCVRKVYAFEPDTRSLAALRYNAGMAGNVQVVPVAVTDVSGTVSFDVRGSAEYAHIGTRGRVQVAATTVDAFTATTGLDVGQIKIDVEGHDLCVLRGAGKTIREGQPLVLTEFSQRSESINDPNELYSLCAGVGYRIYGFAYSADGDPSSTRLREMRQGDGRVSKMLFLVPRRRGPETRGVPRQGVRAV
jgi:FkbM family methyltransferase